jgi:hypothetical protein
MLKEHLDRMLLGGRAVHPARDEVDVPRPIAGIIAAIIEGNRPG